MHYEYRTLAQSIVDSAARYPNNTMTFQDSSGAETSYTYPEFEKRTAEVAAGMQARGMKQGDTVGLVIIEPEDFVTTFMAAQRIGVIPVPLYPPMSMADLDAYLGKLTRIVTDAGATAMIVSDRLKLVLFQLVDRVPSLKRIEIASKLASPGKTPDYPVVELDDISFLQYTSGSTSDPKGVVVTHRSLSANAQATLYAGLEGGDFDTTVSWLPLYHDMGLIGFVIMPLIAGMNAVFIPTMRFLKRPNTWMETVSRHRGTITFCPPFALALAARRAKSKQLDSWDLSSLRVVGVGAEPINADGVRQFTDLFHSRCNLPKNAVLSAYGMAEATLAMSLKRVNEPLKTRFINHQTFQDEGIAVERTPGKEAIEHVSCGVTFPGHEVAAFTEHGVECAEGVEGELRFRGPSVAAGYLGNAEATAETFLSDGWLRTGDLGYIHEGEIYVTGRMKDLIIVNGRNIHPQAIEWPLYEIEGVRRGNVVAFSRPGDSTEELVIVVETRGEAPEGMVNAIRECVQTEFGLAVGDVRVLPAGHLPKTSSGKLQRRRTRQLYLSGRLGVEGSRQMGTNASKVSLARHVARSMWSRVKQATLSLMVFR